MRRFAAGAALLASLALGLAGCAGDSVELPTGTITATGSMKAVGLSLERRGTHALIVDGRERYLLEGGSIDLSSDEGKTVAVTGTVEENIDPKAPPLLRVASLRIVHAEEDRIVALQALGMTLRVPSSWGMSSSGSTQIFMLSDGSPVLSVGAEAYVSNASDIPLLVGGKQAFRSQGKSIAVLIPQGAGAIALRSRVASPTPETDAAFIRVLTSVAFSSASSSSKPLSASGATTSTAPALPCGGAAGLLCPAGWYCSITDPENNIGVCKQPVKK